MTGREWLVERGDTARLHGTVEWIMHSPWWFGDDLITRAFLGLIDPGTVARQIRVATSPCAFFEITGTA